MNHFKEIIEDTEKEYSVEYSYPYLQIQNKTAWTPWAPSPNKAWSKLSSTDEGAFMTGSPTGEIKSRNKKTVIAFKPPIITAEAINETNLQDIFELIKTAPESFLNKIPKQDYELSINEKGIYTLTDSDLIPVKIVSLGNSLITSSNGKFFIFNSHKGLIEFQRYSEFPLELYAPISVYKL